MRIKKQAILLLLVALWQCSLFSQQPNPPIRDPQAISILNQVVSAMGGSVLLGNITAAHINGQVTPADGSGAQLYATKYRVTGSSFLFRKDLTTSKGLSIFASGGGKAVRVLPNGTKQRYNGTHVALAALPFDLPGLLLAVELGNQNYQIELIGTPTPGSPIHLRLEDQSDAITRAVTTQDWFIDPVTYLPIRVKYKLPDVVNALSNIARSAITSDFSH